jgi:hypothetical protein
VLSNKYLGSNFFHQIAENAEKRLKLKEISHRPTRTHTDGFFPLRHCREEELHALRARFYPQLCIWLCHIYFREAMTIFPVKCLVHFTGVCVGLCVSVAKINFCMSVANLFFSECQILNRELDIVPNHINRNRWGIKL